MDNGFTTNDLSLTAWLVFMHQFELVSADRVGRSFLFTMRVPEGKNPDKLKLEFLSSESCRFDATVRDIKKIIFSEK